MDNISRLNSTLFHLNHFNNRKRTLSNEDKECTKGEEIKVKQTRSATEQYRGPGLYRSASVFVPGVRWANQRKPALDKGTYDTLSNEMDILMRNHSQSAELLRQKHELLTLLSTHIPFPATVHLVGSSCNGFASDTSDADVCILLKKTQHTDQVEACGYLGDIANQLHLIPSLKRVQLIPARVPILRFFDSKSSCEFDINMNNTIGIRNSHLLRAYTGLDSRVRPLVFAVKRWAKIRGINDAYQRTLSSYSLVLMTLHYLQCGAQPPVIKSLQVEYPDHFRSDSDVENMPTFRCPGLVSENSQSAGELLEGFFHYFAEVFQWETSTMSVRLGRAVPQCDLPGYVSVEEPFLRTNTASAVFDYCKFLNIKIEFKRAKKRLQDHLSFTSLVDPWP